MNNPTRTTIIPSLLLLGLVLSCGNAKAITPQAYTVTSMWQTGLQAGYVYITTTGINGAGNVAFNYEYSDQCYPLKVGMVNGQGIGIIGGAYVSGGDESSADAINESGQTTGYSALTIENPYCDISYLYEPTAVGPTHAYRSEANGVMRDLGTFGGEYSRGLSINKWGRVAGWAQRADGSTHAFFSGPTGTRGIADLGTLGGRDSGATGANDVGVVVGWSNTSNGATHAFFRASGTTVPLRDLGTLGGMNSYATGVNNSGAVVGFSQNAAGAWRVFVSDTNGGVLRDIGVAAVSPSAYNDKADTGHLRINNRGQVVGSGAKGGFLYTPGVGVQSIDTLFDHSATPDVYFYEPAAINDAGQITGTYDIWDEDAVGTYILTPVPRTETEKAVVTALSGARHTVTSDVKASGGAVTTLAATATGQYVTYAVPVTAAGIYRVKVGVKTGAARGIFQLSIDGVKQGKVQDEYSSRVAYQQRDLGTFIVSAAGKKQFTFTASGRNPSSTGSSLAFDYIELVPTARLETEELAVKAMTPVPAGLTSAQWHGVFASSAASQGAARYFNATAPGQFVAYTVNVPETGYYQIKVGTQYKPNKGMFQLAVNGTNVGGPIDEYSPNTGFDSRDLERWVYLSAGTYTFKFTVTGKNPNSSGYSLAFDYIDLVPET